MTIFQAVRIVAFIMLLLALPQMGDNFYKALRFTIVIAAAMEVWTLRKSAHGEWWKTAASLAFIAAAIFFNPIEPMDFTRPVWIGIDVCVMALLCWRQFNPR